MIDKVIENNFKKQSGMAPAFTGQIPESYREICQDFEPVIPGNIYSFCKHATFWIDGQKGSSCPLRICPYASIYSPLLYGVYCNKLSNK
ncbi:MAG: hypothetical protein AVO38_01970 [delta proteobacterium ML8_D]|nr:MAG: hypothetical protein AVO38_01970 [delta proteobacterium ML8_D]